MLFAFPLVFLPLLLPIVAASNVDTKRCITKYGGYSMQYVPRSTLTHTQTCWDTTTKTVGRMTTVTPRPTTQYVTSTKTIEATKTGIKQTVKTTSTGYATVIRTSSTTVSVATFTAKPTLDPASDSLDFIQKREFGSANEAPNRKLVKRGPGYVKQYPTAVTCTVDVEKRKTKTVTHTALAHTLRQHTYTHTRHSTKTVTHTVYPTTTLTLTTSATRTATLIQTSTIGGVTTTSYSTISGPTPTACGPENLFNGGKPDNRGLINGIIGVFDTGVQQSDLTAKDCCLSCVTSQYCAMSYFIPTNAVGQQCYHLANSNCNSQSGQYGYTNAILGENEIDPAVSWVVSNGYCGTWAGGMR